VPGLVQAIEGLRFQIETPRHAAHLLGTHAGLLATRVRRRAAALHALVWAPLAPALQSVKRLVVVPHGALHYVPWSALHDGDAWLCERFDIEVAASATAWLAAPLQPWRVPVQVLALGSGEERLPMVRQELEALAASVGGSGVRVLLGEAARADALGAQAQLDVLHLACHGQFRADSPAFSSLQLADGPLTLQDLQAARVRAALVVLSACETGLSRIAPGNEMVGLVRGFVLAGADRVLATQWAVSDTSMASLMSGFYRGLCAGAAPREAVCAVQRAAAASGAHPFGWAALALYGRR
jgi:CHAT domain-containing protein